MIEKCLGSSISTTIHLDNALNIFHGDCTSNADLLPYPALIATNLDSSNQFKRVRSTLILCVPPQVHSLSRAPSRFCCDVEQHWRNKLFVAAVAVSSLVRSDSSRQPVGLFFQFLCVATANASLACCCCSIVTVVTLRPMLPIYALDCECTPSITPNLPPSYWYPMSTAAI